MIDSRVSPGTILYGLGILGFYWYALTGFWGISGHHLSLLFLVIFFAYWVIGNWEVARKSSLLWLSVIYSVWVAVRAIFGYVDEPQTLGWQVRHTRDFINVGGLAALPLVPWMLGRHIRHRLNWAFTLIVLSLFIQVYLELFVHPDGVDIQELPSGRPGFQMGPNTFGLLCAILLVGTAVLGYDLVHRVNQERLEWKRTALTACVLLPVAGALLSGLIISQSRASWLGTIAAIVFLVAHIAWRNRNRKYGLWVAPALLVVVTIALGLLSAQWELVQARILGQWGTIAKVASMELDNLPRDAVGQRIWLWQAGIEAVAERPIVGWSPADIRSVIETRVPPGVPRNFHNVPIQLAVALGGVGLFLFLSMIWISVREIVWAGSAQYLPREWCTLWLAAIVLLGVESAFDFPMYDVEYRFIVIFLAAIAMAAQIERLAQEHGWSWTCWGRPGSMGEETKRRVTAK